MNLLDAATEATPSLAERDALADELNALITERDQLGRHLAHTRERLDQARKALDVLYVSPEWRFLRACCRLRDRLLPPRSRRRAALGALLKASVRLGRRLRGRKPGGGPRASDDGYPLWIALNEPGLAELEEQRRTRFASEPTVSVVVPTWDPPPPFLTALLESVLAQTYARWELCIADGGSRDPEVREVLRRFGARDPRVKVRFLPANRGIAGNSQAALGLATGAYVALLDHDDTLAPFALHEVVRAVNRWPDADLIYSDEDTIDAGGTRRANPHFKPDWSPDLLRGCNYVCHLAVFRRALVRQVGGFRPGFEGAQDYDLTLRVGERARRVVHVPKVLYHWRVHPGSVTADEAGKGYAYASARRALRDHLRRRGVAGAVADGPRLGTYRVTYPLAGLPLVSVIIPSRDQAAALERCVASVARSTYPRHEIHVVENQSREPATFACYERLRRDGVRVSEWHRPFSFAAVNNRAATLARGEVLLFLNNDVEAVNPDWLERLLEHALRPEVGAVGAKLCYRDGTVQHGGVVLGVGGVAGHAHRHFHRDDPGYARRLLVAHNLSAVTGACLMIRRDVFEDVGGFDERFALIYNDVDLCLRLRQKGYLIVWTPAAELYHDESTTRGGDDRPHNREQVAKEIALLRGKWGDVLRDGDPYYNPNLTLQREDFSLRV